MKIASEAGTRIALATSLLLRELIRRRSAVAAVLALPFVFYAVVLATAPHRQAEVMIPALAEPGLEAMEGDAPVFDRRWVERIIDDGTRNLDQHAVSVVFLGGAAVAFLAAFVAFYLMHERIDADRRLTQCGFGADQLFLSRVLALACLVIPIATLETALVCSSLAPSRPGSLFAAYALLGFVYGGFGLLIGSVVRQELAGVFLIVLLANVDVGWLQNPAYYAESRSKWLIQTLPGHDALQFALASAFEAATRPGTAIMRATCTAVLLLGAAALAYRLRTARRSVYAPSSERWAYTKITLLAYAGWLLCFEIVGNFAATLPTRDLSLPLDRAISVMPFAVWAYEACYLLPFVTLLVIRDWHRMNVALVAALIANASAFLVYLFLPVAFPRPTLGTSLAERVLAFEYAMDFSPGANKLPSMHVAMSFLFLFACRKQGLSKLGSVGLSVLVIVVSISTVLVKQHLVLDVVAGVIWACAAWTAARRIYERPSYLALPPRRALRRLFSWRRLVWTSR